MCLQGNHAAPLHIQAASLLSTGMTRLQAQHCHAELLQHGVCVCVQPAPAPSQSACTSPRGPLTCRLPAGPAAVAACLMAAAAGGPCRWRAALGCETGLAAAGGKTHGCDVLAALQCAHALCVLGGGAFRQNTWQLSKAWHVAAPGSAAAKHTPTCKRPTAAVHLPHEHPKAVAVHLLAHLPFKQQLRRPGGVQHTHM